MSIYVCARLAEAKDGETNIFIINENERIALNPVYIQRAKRMLADCEEVISRTPHVSIILEAAKISYKTEY